MIKVRKTGASESSRMYFAKCDCEGLRGRWNCENLGPAAGDRREAGDVARTAGWIVVHLKWYCPQCQRDGLAPRPNGSEPTRPYESLP